MEKIDFLTKLWLFESLKKVYHSYLKKHAKSFLIAIDFAKLKLINDNFGHGIGDTCLRSFADIMREVFPEEILVRRSGDEFVIVTSLAPMEIEQRIETMQQQIILLHENKEIPMVYTFNSGIKECEEDFDHTLFLADITMYKAKGEQLLYLSYTEQIYTSFQKNDEFLHTLDVICEKRDSHFVFQRIHRTKQEETEMLEIYMRGLEDQSLFEPNKRKVLLYNHRFRKLDLMNLQTLFQCYSHYFLHHRMIVNLHYQTLLFRQYNMIILLEELLEKYKIPKDHLILSISVLEFDGKLLELEEVLRRLSQLSISLCIDHLDISTSHLFLSLIDHLPISYVKISHRFLKEALSYSKASSILKSLLALSAELHVTPIFISVENEEEYQFIMSLEQEKLLKGHYLSVEEKMKKCEK